MRWAEIRAAFPERWLVIEALDIDHVSVVAVCADPLTARKRSRELWYADPRRKLLCVHTQQRELAVAQRFAA